MSIVFFYFLILDSTFSSYLMGLFEILLIYFGKNIVQKILPQKGGHCYWLNYSLFHSNQRNWIKISNLNTFESSPCADSQCISTDPGQPYSYHEHTSHLFVSSQYSHLQNLFLCVCVCLRVRVWVWVNCVSLLLCFGFFMISLFPQNWNFLRPLEKWNQLLPFKKYIHITQHNTTQQ